MTSSRSGATNPPPGDKYLSFAELAACAVEGRDYSRRLEDRSSPIAILAPHGGGIEPGTSEIAAALAGDVFSLYCFEGLKPVRNAELHLTSTRFDEPLCLRLLAATRTAITIHGATGRGAEIIAGGRDERLKSLLAAALAAAGFTVEADGSGRTAGHDERNLCNRGTSGEGVQLELRAGFRRSLFAGRGRSGRWSTTPAFDAFVAAVRGALIAAGGATAV